MTRSRAPTERMTVATVGSSAGAIPKSRPKKRGASSGAAPKTTVPTPSAVVSRARLLWVRRRLRGGGDCLFELASDLVAALRLPVADQLVDRAHRGTAQHHFANLVV